MIYIFLILGIIVVSLVLFIISRILIILGIRSPYSKFKFSKITRKKVSKEFKKIYNSIITEYAQTLEIERKKLILCLTAVIVIAVITIILILYISFILVDTKIRPGILAIFFLPLAFFYTYYYKKTNKEYVKNYKDIFIKNFINNINPQLSYNKNGGKELYDYYIDGQYEDRNYNNFYADDYITGYNEDGTTIEMCNIALKNEDKQDNYIKTIYEGIFSVSFFNIAIPNEVRIKKNSIKNNSNKVEMDSKEFEKYFDVYSDSHILAMEIFTHDIMQEIIDFYNSYKINFEILLKGNKMYIKFDTGKMFEPNILRKSSDIKTLWVFYNVIEFITNFTAKINKLLKDIEI